MEIFRREESLPKNPEHLLKPTKIRSRGGWCFKGSRVEAGTEICVPKYVASELVDLHKAEYVQ